jgi:hypothetical protein
MPQRAARFCNPFGGALSVLIDLPFFTDLKTVKAWAEAADEGLRLLPVLQELPALPASTEPPMPGERPPFSATSTWELFFLAGVACQRGLSKMAHPILTTHTVAARATGRLRCSLTAISCPPNCSTAIFEPASALRILGSAP